MNWKKQVFTFISAQMISLLGSSIVQYAIIWFITLQTGSGFMLSVATICGFLPQLLISLFAGVWADRYPRKVLCMVADAIISVATGIVMIFFMCGIRNISLLFMVLLVRSAMTGIQLPAVNALLPQVTPEDKLMRVNGIYNTVTSIMNFLAPALSGAILSFMDIQYTFMIDIITAIIGIGMMFTLHVPDYHPVQVHSSMKADMKATVKYLKVFPALLGLLCFMCMVSFFISPTAFFTPLMIARSFGGEVWKLTISEMVFSLGAVVGGVAISTWGGFHRHAYTVIVATLLYGAMMIGLGSSGIFVIYLFFNFMIGITMPCYSTPSQVLIQTKVEPAMHGRIFSLVQIANASALPLGTAMFGPIADMIPLETIFILCGSIVILLAIIAFLALGRISTGKRIVSE